MENINEDQVKAGALQEMYAQTLAFATQLDAKQKAIARIRLTRPSTEIDRTYDLMTQQIEDARTTLAVIQEEYDKLPKVEEEAEEQSNG